MLSIEYQEKEKKLFTADYAIEVANTEDAERINFKTAKRIAEEHGACIFEFIDETNANQDCIDAGDLLVWLGY